MPTVLLKCTTQFREVTRMYGRNYNTNSCHIETRYFVLDLQGPVYTGNTFPLNFSDNAIHSFPGMFPDPTWTTLAFSAKATYSLKPLPITPSQRPFALGDERDETVSPHSRSLVQQRILLLELHTNLAAQRLMVPHETPLLQDLDEVVEAPGSTARWRGDALNRIRI